MEKQVSLNASKIASAPTRSIKNQIDALSPHLTLSARRYFVLQDDAASLAAETISLGQRELASGEAEDIKASLFAIMRRIYLAKL
jgi:hypothetical protein